MIDPARFTFFRKYVFTVLSYRVRPYGTPLVEADLGTHLKRN
jgi:hypothetical protein